MNFSSRLFVIKHPILKDNTSFLVCCLVSLSDS